MKNTKKNRKGFTLVELMVVVVIIGILVAIAIPVYNTITKNAEAKACLANQRTIDSAIMAYIADNGTSPDNIAALVGDYIAETPACPSESQCTYDIDKDLGLCTSDGKGGDEGGDEATNSHILHPNATAED